jgi:hypothetical protein
MATCPRCGGFLDDRHRCTGLWRLRLRALRSTVLGGLVGGVLGWLVNSIAFGSASWPSIGIAALLGMIIVRSLIRGEPYR